MAKQRYPELVSSSIEKSQTTQKYLHFVFVRGKPEEHIEKTAETWLGTETWDGNIEEGSILDPQPLI